MSESTVYDTIHTTDREADEEEISLKPEYYSILGCLPPITDSQAVMITPVVALLNKLKFIDFRLLHDEITAVFYLDLK
ncbi:unnamed protein product [Rotaria sp. Silwood2]|nr:unnamed protein product [Rotaria sp. Silwood2]CAF2666952.1 unnamed protein product [Rotaria sp. Silwood2]CAF3875674.1 unnamed protein product [Rotaria sp. Silwood2]CAF4029736.1 unnamed protein product [Rotaria sp. Silwood2]